jgi:hypothetical protein
MAEMTMNMAIIEAVRFVFNKREPVDGFYALKKGCLYDQSMR